MLPLQANEMEKLVIYALYKTLSMMINKGAKKEERDTAGLQTWILLSFTHQLF
jgi:hypothetical protein